MKKRNLTLSDRIEIEYSLKKESSEKRSFGCDVRIQEY